MSNSGIFVVGSINQDFVLRVERRPSPGETVTDAELSLSPGGKGANQAVAASRLGVRTEMLGRVGDDPFGEPLVQNLGDNGVGTEYVKSIPDTPTGSAFITVTPDGENAIVVSPGASQRLDAEAVEDAGVRLQSCGVMLAQMEVPVEAMARAAGIARDAGVRTVLNLAPPRGLPGNLLALTDPLIVNEHEASFLLGGRVGRVDAAQGAVADLCTLGPHSAVITLGFSGAVAGNRDYTFHIPAPEIPVTDTTGAGDAFAGALAAQLSRDATLEEAVSYAVRAGATAVTREGTQGALPYAKELDSF
jgi:ribokinase